ncbi:phosphoglycerate mutase [Bacterioplanes sanyensis]|uniref:histidine phosphatase family protein n=1 Tax=Bacterioplanes sanyensis TaxID=1249553 RepID=UPI001673C3FC|nr:histidine phosphatase family protein [Bacterioplanes sanyensis]GGY52442.1 phosphoglycerate mutase [Bacterioplanes sanyensis]
MKIIYVVSHTESEHHLSDLVGGWYDSELTEKGVADENAIAEFLNSEAKVEAIISSDLKRARSTAECIARVLNAPVTVNAALREMSFGDAEGKEQSWLNERIKPEDGDNRLDHRIVSGAETKREFAGRIYQYLDSIELPDCAVISTHSFAATYVIAWWIGMPLESVGYVNFGVKPGKITKLVEDDFFKNRAVAYLNQ